MKKIQRIKLDMNKYSYINLFTLILTLILSSVVFATTGVNQNQEATEPNLININESDLSIQNIELPASVSGEKEDGQGTLVDYLYTGKKEFFTINTREGTTLYLIIDHDKTEKNVYFLTNLSDDDIAYAQNVRDKQSGNTNNANPIGNIFGNQNEEIAKTENITVETKDNNKKIPILPILFAITFALVLGVGYYIKILKPKKNKKVIEDDDDDDDDDVFEFEDDDDDAFEFEDDDE